MAPPLGPYSGTSTLALVARVSAFTSGLIYGSIKLKVLKDEILLSQKLTVALFLFHKGRAKKSHKIAESAGHA